MYLKRHLGFVGNRENNIITIHNPEPGKSDIEIETDNFMEIWSLLELLKNERTSDEEWKSWKEKYHVTEEKYQEYIRFLLDRSLLYTNEEKEESNPRTLNFLNNLSGVSDRYKVLEKLQNKYMVIIGVGTVGTSVIRYLLQFGIKQIILIDMDKVEEKNLLHQTFYRREHIGKQKCEALKEILLDLDSELEIKTIEKRIDTLEDLTKNLLKENVDSLFCCFDQHSKPLLKEIIKYAESNSIHAYISAYYRQTAVGGRLTNHIIERILNAGEFRISENSGIGLMGDLGAQMMLRIWLQDKFLKLNYAKDYLEYNFLEALSSDLETNLDYTDWSHTSFGGKKFQEYYRQTVVYPRILMMYKEYLKNQDENLFYEIRDTAHENELEVFLEEDIEMEEYTDKIANIKIECENNVYSLDEFGAKYLLRQEKCPKEIMEEFWEKQKTLREDVLFHLRRKKERYYEEYLKIWKDKTILKDSLIKLAQSFIDINCGKKVDFSSYNPLSDFGFKKDVSEQLMLAAVVDKMIPGYDMAEFIRYMSEHQFLHISPQYNVCCNIMNERYGAVDIIVHYEETLLGFLSLCHELGHAYYSSYFPALSKAETMTTRLSETLACMNEFLVQFSLIQGNELDKKQFQGLLLYLHSNLVGTLSLDLYEENILKLEDISWPTILKERRKGEKLLFGDREIVNNVYSDYNISLSTEFLFEKRNPYLYPEAYLYGFFLAKMIWDEKENYFCIITYLKSAEDGLDIRNLCQDIFKKEMTQEFYNEMVEKFLSYVYYLKKRSDDATVM